MSAWPGGDVVGRTGVTFESLVSPGTRLAEFFPAGDGVTNDYVHLQAAINAAYATGLLELEAGKTYITGATLTITQPLVIRGNNATIKKTTTLNGYILNITGVNVTLRDFTLDGNKSGGNAITVGCLIWGGNPGGVAFNMKVTNTASLGFVVNGAGGIVDAYDCTATFCSFGFYAGGGAIGRFHNCRGDDNTQMGMYISGGAAAGCHIDGTFNDNLHSGVQVFGPSGTGGRIVTRNNKTFGYYISGALVTDWVFEYLEDHDCGQGLNGKYTPQPDSTAMEVFGVTRVKFQDVYIYHPSGYGIAIGRDSVSGLGCTEVSFTGEIASGQDPAVFIGGGSKRCVINAVVRHGPVACSFGEGTQGQSDDNIVNITAHECTYAVLNLNQGSRNHFRIRAIDCITNPTLYTSLARIGVIGGGGYIGVCEDNVIHWESSNPNSVAPPYIFKFDPSVDTTVGVVPNVGGNSTQRNKVIGGFAQDYATGLYQDPNGTNRVNLDRHYDAVVPYSASMTLDVSQADYFKITVTNGTAMTINAPVNMTIGHDIRIEFLNSSGGAMGAVTWNAVFKTAGAITNPANTKLRWIDFYWNGTNWIETGRAAADI